MTRCSTLTIRGSRGQNAKARDSSLKSSLFGHTKPLKAPGRGQRVAHNPARGPFSPSSGAGRARSQGGLILGPDRGELDVDF